MITGNEPAMPLNSESANAYGMTGEATAGYGLTIRQEFAKAAMQGLCANSIPGQHHSFPFLAAEAVQYADALIAELNKTKI